MSVSLVVPCKNGESTLQMCLDSISLLDYSQGFDLILVDDGSTDKTREIMQHYAHSHSNVKILDGGGKLGAGNAINIGWRSSNSNIIAVTNADCVLDKNWLTEIVKPFNNSLVGGVSGKVLTPKGLNLLQRLIGYELEYRYSQYPEYILSPQDSGLAYRREVLEKINGYDINFKTGYDVDIGYRVNLAGYKIKYNPLAIVWHYHRADLKSYWKQQTQTSRARKKILLKHPYGIKGDNLANSTLMMLPILVFAIVISTFIVFLFPLSWYPQFVNSYASDIIIFYAVIVSFYFTLIFNYVIEIYNKCKKLESLFLVPLMVYRSLALAWGILS